MMQFSRNNAIESAPEKFKKVFQWIQTSGPKTAKEYAIAKMLLIKQIQITHFGEAILAIQRKTKNTLVTQLGLQLDGNGILRCHGRMRNAELPETAKFPILLPRRSQPTDLIIKFTVVLYFTLG